jgi:HprK-related kinase A
LTATFDAASLAAVDIHRIQEALQSDGLWFGLGATTVCVNGNSRALASQIQSVYRHFPFQYEGAWADIHARVDEVGGLRRLIRRQVVFSSDARVVFAPFPADSPLPLLEWGCNWLIGHRLNHLLLFHAGALERDGLALLLPATPGSGKSTLSAALSLRGWRLMSDEFGAFDLRSGNLRAVLKPVALKNESIAVIRRFAPEAEIGPEFPKTRKGTVAHLAAQLDAVQRRAEPAMPGAVILPRWEANSPTRWEPVAAHNAFSALAFNAFNYQLLGEAGFDAVLNIVRRCLAWELVYSDLDDAIRAIEQAWPSVVANAQK